MCEELSGCNLLDVSVGFGQMAFGHSFARLTANWSRKSAASRNFRFARTVGDL
jgi:hypothetical protein